jgi:hypothetical protein
MPWLLPVPCDRGDRSAAAPGDRKPSQPERRTRRRRRRRRRR